MTTIAIDIDGTALVYPEKVNKLFNQKNTCIVMFTNRPEILREQTVNELQEKGIKYDALVMEKLSFDYIIDDRSSNFDLEYIKL